MTDTKFSAMNTPEQIGEQLSLLHSLLLDISPLEYTIAIKKRAEAAGADSPANGIYQSILQHIDPSIIPSESPTKAQRKDVQQLADHLGQHLSLIHQLIRIKDQEFYDNAMRSIAENPQTIKEIAEIARQLIASLPPKESQKVTEISDQRRWIPTIIMGGKRSEKKEDETE